VRTFLPGATLLPLAILSASACGGSGRGPQAPSALPTAAAAGLAAGSVISLVSGEDHEPVSGARVVVAGREYGSDAAGQVTLAEPVSYGSLVDVVAAGFLNRQTALRSGATRFVLWPRATASGLDEAFTAQIVYTWGSASPPAHGSNALQRIRDGATLAVVVLSPQLLEDGAAHQAHVAAVDDLNASLAGRMRYVLAAEAPPGGVVFRARVDPAEPLCADARAFFDGDFARGEIVGGAVVYCSLDVARASTVAHELGHSTGLQHVYGGNELMTPSFSRARRATFGAREGLAMKLLFERRAGNLFPDTDRGVAGTAIERRRIVCP
jgi:hypothetical protein